MVFLLFFLGLAVGSFLNVLIDRLPKGESVIWGRSRCDHCKKPLRWWELMPVLSFLFLEGRCRRCHKAFTIQYPLVELATGIGFVYLGGIFPPSSPLVGVLVLFSCLLVMLVADAKYQIIPDSMVVLGIVAAIVFVFSVAPH